MFWCPLDDGKYKVTEGQVLIVKDSKGFIPYLQLFCNWPLIERVEGLARDVRLVFYKLVFSVRIENEAMISIEQIERALDLSKLSVCNSLKVLGTQNLIRAVRSNVYLITPYLIWRGSQDTLLKAMGEWDNFKAISALAGRYDALEIVSIAAKG